LRHTIKKRRDMMINAIEFDDISTKVFYPIYEVIARQIKQRTGNKEYGYCMDVGSGTGYLGIAMAKITNMEVTLYDISKDILEIANHKVAESGLEHQVETELGNVEEIPKEDESVDLIISRGSMFFWEDREKAFKEIYRVLKIGGYAYLGGGFGTKELKADIDKKMLVRDPEWLSNCKKRKGNPQKYIRELENAGIKTYSISDNEKGLWIIIEKSVQNMDK
jgi:ubiquinone/menaquinone biosynthesis C-methylase UbiE